MTAVLGPVLLIVEMHARTIAEHLPNHRKTATWILETCARARACDGIALWQLFDRAQEIKDLAARAELANPNRESHKKRLSRMRYEAHEVAMLKGHSSTRAEEIIARLFGVTERQIRRDVASGQKRRKS